jgi:ADP-heptose:LPS heptosyltransferase
LHDLAGRLSLRGLTGLLSRAVLIVSNDTGPLHLAAAVGTPTVGVYWCFNLITADPLTRRLHRPLVSWRLDCPICGRSQVDDPCEHQVSYVADVPVESVVEQALDVLQIVTVSRSEQDGGHRAI